MTRLLFILISSILISCASDDSSTNNSDSSEESNNNGNNSTSTITGTFVDDPVYGLEYECGSTQGITNDKGEFTCPTGSTVRFFLGGIEFGSSTVSEVITPEELAPSEIDNQQSTKAKNILRFIQSLDSGDNTGIITITESVRNLAKNQNLDLSEDNTLFESEAQSILTSIAGVVLKSETDAINHFKNAKTNFFSNIEIEHSDLNIILGQKVQYSFSGTQDKDDKKIDLTDRVTWEIADTNIVSIEESGKIEGKAVGTSQVVLSFGNHSKTLTVTVRLSDDQQAPVLQGVNINSHASSTTSNHVQVYIFASDNVGITHYLIKEDGTNPTYNDLRWVAVDPTTQLQSTFDFSFASDNESGSFSKGAYVWVKDAAGNISNRNLDFITVNVADTFPPKINSMIINSGIDPTSDTNIKISLNASDDVTVAGYFLSTTSNTPENNSTGWTFINEVEELDITIDYEIPVFSSGSFTETLYLWVQDQAGNISSTPASDDVTVLINDQQKPEISIFTINTGDEQTYSNQVYLQLDASDDVGLDSYFISTLPQTPDINSLSWTTFDPTKRIVTSLSFDFNETELGSYTKTFYAWVKDTSNNVSFFKKDDIELIVIRKIEEVFFTNYAMAVLRDDNSVLTWGDDISSLYITPETTDLTNVKQVFTTNEGFAALKYDGTVEGWGYFNQGDTSDVDSELTNVKTIHTNLSSFVAEKENGEFVAWGSSTNGGNISSAIQAQLTNVKEIIPGLYAFAALKNDGTVVTWGSSSYGGNSSSVASELTDIEKIFSIHDGFVAVKQNGKAIFWGLEHSADIPFATVSNDLIDIKNIYHNQGANIALLEDGTIVGWGRPNYGGDTESLPSSHKSGVKEVYASNQAFAVLKTNGYVYSWPDTNDQGDASEISQNFDVVNIIAGDSAFAALKEDGSVAIWGVDLSGGEAFGYASDLFDIVSITANNSSFMALKEDKTVVGWGNRSSGGNRSIYSVPNNQTSVIDQLVNVKKLYSGNSRFAAITEEGFIVTWGVSDEGGDSSSVDFYN